MRRMSRGLSLLLMLLSIMGLLMGAMFIRHEDQLAAERQRRMLQLTEALKPISEQRSELEARDNEWRTILADEREGKPCVMLCFNTMNHDLYNTIFSAMKSYECKGTFVLRDGLLPGQSPDSISAAEMEEMLNTGWDYAVAEGVVCEKKTESGVLTPPTDEEERFEERDSGWITSVEDYLDVLDDAGVERPFTLFCTPEQYNGVSDKTLKKLGFRNVCLLDESGFPVIDEPEGDIWQLEGGLYTQSDMKMQERIDNAVLSQKSMILCINEVVRLYEGTGSNLSLTRFNSLLSRLRTLKEAGYIYVLTFSEFREYKEQLRQTYDSLRAQYAIFHEEMEEQMAELDQQEKAIVDSLNQE